MKKYPSNLLRIWSIMMLSLVSLGLLLACGDNTATAVPPTTAANTSTGTTSAATTNATTIAATTAFPIEVTDDAGRKVKITKAPTRIISLAPSNTEILYDLGLADKVVGVDQYSDYPAEAKNKAQVGSFSDINMEKVVSLTPDLVLATNLHSKTVVPALEKQNLTVIVLQPNNIAGIKQNFELLGKVTGVPAVAAEREKAFQARLDKVTEKLKSVTKKTTLFFDVGDLYTAGPGSFLNDMIEKAGGANIVTDTSTAYPQLSNEKIIDSDPDVIITSFDLNSLKGRAGWDKISAVKNNRLFAIDPNLTNRPGPRVAEGIELIAKILYPDLFK